MAGIISTARRLLGFASKVKSFNIYTGSSDSNTWQIGGSNSTTGADIYTSSAVEAVIGQISRSLSMLPVIHYRDDVNGGKEVIKNSYVTKVIRKPNFYQNKSDFILNLIRALLFEGNGYAAVTRDERFKIQGMELIHPNKLTSYKDNDGDVYYYVSNYSGNKSNDPNAYMIPYRDMLHVRMQTGSDPLKGISPLSSSLASISSGNNIQSHNATFFSNMSRPSGVLTTDLELDGGQIDALRTRWESQSAKLNSGKTPILSSGLKWDSLAMSATDAELVKFYELSVSDIARIYGVPSALINLTDSSSTFSNVESLLNMWIATSLAPIIDNLELTLEDLFELPQDEHINFDFDYMLRGDLKARMDALSKGISGGIMSINEARLKTGLKDVEGGDDIRLQMQNVPLDYYQDKLDQDQQKIDQDQQKIDNQKEMDDKPPELVTVEPTLSEEDKHMSAMDEIRRAMA